MSSDATPQVEVQDRRRVDTLMQLDESTLDPSLHYRWVSDQPLLTGRARMKGYRPVMADSGVRTQTGHMDDAADGTIRIGTLILMACPKAEYEKRRKGQLSQAERRLTAPGKQFRKSAKRHKARILKEEEE